MARPKRKQTLTAIIYDRRGRVISVGQNNYLKSHPKMLELCQKTEQNQHRIYLHAEVAAIVKAAKKREQPHHIHIMRFNKDGKPMLAAPCPMCQLAIKMAGIKIVTYTKNDDSEDIDDNGVC